MTNRKLYIFNPDNDLALANGDENYMPPASARKMTLDLALLPIWYATPDSFVLAPSAYNLSFRNEMNHHFSSLPVLITEPEVTMSSDFLPVPWGWNVALRKYLYRLGISDLSLPDMGELNNLRDFSSRLKAVYLLPTLQLNPSFCGFSAYSSSINELETFLEKYPEVILKAPWSGSGKGLCYVKNGLSVPVINWCSRVIRQQGGVVIEPLYQKVEDFAMEFYLDRGKVSFVGYSLFYTGTGGAYEGSFLLTDKAIESALLCYVSAADLAALRFHLEDKLFRMFSATYIGYIGVDMMICSFKEKPQYRIHPCVELNLRMNMGVLARLFYDHYVVQGSIGKFRVQYFSNQGDALRKHEEFQQKYPVCISGGRLAKGYFSLTPVTIHTQYVATVLLD